MTYDEAQVVSQLIAGGIFFCLLVCVAIYAFRPSKKAEFDHMARIPIESEQLKDNN